MEEKIQEIISIYRSQINDDKIFFYPYIPPKKLGNAIAAYGGNDGAEDALALIDNTTFGNAKDGLLLTRSGVHVHNMLEAAFHLGLHEIRDVQFKGGMLESSISINDIYVFKSNMPKKSNTALFAEMLTAVVGAAKVEALNVPQGHSVKEALKELKDLLDEGLLTGACPNFCVNGSDFN
ncbi:hypothetical protein [Alicycliphilus denitrificans]|uniref:hypothetical protein n=1 Tax=Alicycliphilus denitrificans TaxID=179636 RepID=UPI0011AED2FD|nr:hypothetical protein [Alicycliphilus denitrificans]